MEVVSSVALVIMVVMVVVETPAVASTLIVMAMSTLVVTNYEDSDGGESCRGSTVLSVVVKVSVSGNSGRVSHGLKILCFKCGKFPLSDFFKICPVVCL